MMRFALVLLLCLLLPSAAQAEKRVALLIGNQSYASEIGPLANPHNDVALLEKALKSLGFEVATVRDAGLAALHRHVNSYVRRVRAAGPNAVGFFYYAGHGASDAGTNYLIPVDVASAEEGELWDRSLRVTEITGKLKAEAGTATHFVIFDACRNNLRLRKTGSRALVQSRGLMRVSEERGMLIAYATAEGELASDAGVGGGPYARVLAEEIVKPGVEAVAMFRNVQRRVRAAIGQEPYLGFNALGDVYLAGPPPDPPKATAAPPPVPEAAERAWALVKDSADVRTLEAFRRQYGAANPFFDRLAETRIEALKRAEADRQAAEAAKKKADEEARAKAEAERQRLALLKQEEERKRAEAEAAKQAADAAKKKADEEARAKAEAERRRLALLKQEEDRKRAEVEAAKQKKYDADKLVAMLNKTPNASAAEGKKVGQVFRDCRDCPEMVVVPAGEFMMGADPAENAIFDDNFDNEGPQRKVTILRPFAVGKFEVTFAEWDACVAVGGCKHSPKDYGWGRGRRPVIGVSWDDITREYLPWLSLKSGKSYRLLTEAEWEYAARAGSTTSYYWGSNRKIFCTYANGADQALNDRDFRGRPKEKWWTPNCRDGYWNTAPVGSFRPNAFGLYDMLGNVIEWVQDCYVAGYTGAPSDGSAVTSGDCSKRVLRGGSWQGFSRSLRSAGRFSSAPAERGGTDPVSGPPDSDQYSDQGFRVARALD